MAKDRKELKLFIAEGEKACMTMLRKSSFDPVLICITHQFKYPSALENLPLSIISAKDMSRISQLKTPSDILVVFRMPSNRIESLQGNGRIIYLDNVQDPGNVGTIIRIADWFGIPTIVRSSDSADFFNPKVVQATMGSLANVSLYDGELQSISYGRIVYGAFMDGIQLRSVEWNENSVLVLGSEGRGISPANYPLIQNKIAIPGVSSRLADSLNVSVAAGIICAEWSGA
ncbi:MAG: RNA methyltransferase [Saprospiraceae bacterium]